MVELFGHKRLLSYLESYFDTLTKTGYTTDGTRRLYLRLMLISDLVDDFYDFLTEEDYRKLDDTLLAMMGNGNCLLSYPVFCQRRAILGQPRYMAYGKVRITEETSDTRATETDNLRGV